MVQETVLDRLETDNLRVYVIWTPVLREDNREAAAQSTGFIPDDRARHFWDEDKSLGQSCGQLVTLPRKRELAWDVYFVFNRESVWNEQPPEPTEWMHQLGLDDRTLDGAKIRSAVENILPVER